MTTAMQFDFSTADQSWGSLVSRPSNHHWVSPAPWTVTEATEEGAELAAAPSVVWGAATWRRILVADFSDIEALLGWGGRRRLPGGREGFLDRAKGVSDMGPRWRPAQRDCEV